MVNYTSTLWWYGKKRDATSPCLFLSEVRESVNKRYTVADPGNTGLAVQFLSEKKKFLRFSVVYTALHTKPGQVMDADNVVVLEETDADGAPVLHKKERSDGAKMVGLHRNPSGQSTIAFDRRLKKRKKTEEECNREADGSTPEKKMKKVGVIG